MTPTRTWAGLVAVALTLASCAAAFPPLKPAAQPLGRAVGVPWEELLVEESIRVERAGATVELVVTEHGQRRLVRPGRLPALAAYVDRSFSRLEAFEARVVLPDGTARPLDPKDRQDTPEAGAGILYDDVRRTSWAVPPLPVGGVVEWRTVVRSRDPRAWFESFAPGPAPVRLARLRVEAPDGIDVGFTPLTPSGTRPWAPAPVAAATGKAWALEAADLPEVITEPMGPRWLDLAPRLLVRLERWPGAQGDERAFGGPDELGRWMRGQQRPRAQADAAMETTVREVLKDVGPEPRARAKALYEYVCRRVNYCAIEVGYGGWVPHPATDVHRAGAGDCKDKANYLSALLAVAGIDSELVALYSHQGQPKPFEVPSLGANFNHAILAVHLDGGVVYADPTWRAVPFGQLPAQDADAPALHQADGTTLLRRTPAARAEDNRTTQRFEVTVAADGSLAGRFEVRALGHPGVRLQQSWLDRSLGEPEWAERWLWLAQAKVDQLERPPGADFAPEVRLEGRLHSDGQVVPHTPELLLLRGADLLDSPLGDVEPGRRRTPWLRLHPSTDEAMVQVTLPAGATCTLPPPRVVSSPLGAATVTWREEPGRLVLVRTTTLLRHVVPPTEFPKLEAFARELREAEAATAIVHLPPREGR